MKVFNSRLIFFTSQEESLQIFERIGVDSYGISAMMPKTSHFNIFIESIPCYVANILKQEMLSIGGDAAVNRQSVSCKVEKTDCLIMGTRKQLVRLIEKLMLQPSFLRGVAEEVKQLLENVDRKEFVFKTSRREIQIGCRTLVMGVLNVTPDSFSDGGKYLSAENAIRHGLRMADEGADIIDVGGESSRPGAEPVTAEEEKRRVLPIIEALAKKVNVPISIDTTKSEVAKAAIDAGAEIVNDISAMNFDPEMVKVIHDTGAGVILMHMRGRPKDMQKGDLTYFDLIGEILGYLREAVEKAKGFGVPEDNIVVDPGIGFGKKPEDNLKILKHLREFKSLGRPVMIGTSRKSFIAKITGQDSPEERIEGTAASVTAAVLQGCNIVRVHDVAFMKRVVGVADAIRAA
ncbi:MAG: dihydropteroate synthase [Syntrophales bacterium]|nr:dihydropteroate synthase [Syntrophales bacterium]